jgi:hypothetical protein
METNVTENSTLNAGTEMKVGGESHVCNYQWLEGVAVTGTIVIMLAGMFLVFSRLKSLGQGFGPNSLKALVPHLANDR